MISFSSFEELEAWRLAREVRMGISQIAKTFPRHERFGFTDQIIRSSRSIGANIAEGFGRHHDKENIQYCRVARGSLSETLEHLHCAFDEGYINEEAFQKHKILIKNCWKVLNGYIAYLSRSKGKRQPTQQLNNLTT